MTTRNAWEVLHGLVRELDTRRVDYTLRIIRPNYVMILAAVPGELWEIEVGEDGEVEIERFRSSGTILDESALVDLWALAD